MPVIKSAIKKARQDIKRRQVNRLKKDHLKELVKTAKKQPTEKNVRQAISFADKMGGAKLIHKKRAAHLKSGLSKLLTKKGPKDQVKKRSVKRKIKAPRAQKTSRLKKTS